MILMVVFKKTDCFCEKLKVPQAFKEAFTDFFPTMCFLLTDFALLVPDFFPAMDFLAAAFFTGFFLAEDLAFFTVGFLVEGLAF